MYITSRFLSEGVPPPGRAVEGASFQGFATRYDSKSKERLIFEVYLPYLLNLRSVRTVTGLYRAERGYLREP